MKMRKKRDTGSKKDAVYSIEKVRVPVGSLMPGMYVCELDRPWKETPFLFQGFLLNDKTDIEAVQECCDFVYIDVRKQELFDSSAHSTRQDSASTRQGNASTQQGNASTRQNPHYVGGNAAAEGEGVVTLSISTSEINNAKKIRVGKTPEKKASFEKEFNRATGIFSEARGVVDEMMEEVRLGNSIDTKAARLVVSACVDSVITNQDAMLWLSQLKDKDKYTAEHSLNVCLLSIAFGRHLGMPVSKLEEVGLCGMLHDMGKMLTPIEVLNKPDKLSVEEFEIIKKHPADGRDILMAGEGVFPGVINVVHGHHEWVNGNGYPRGLNATEITPYTKMVAIVDAYDAITSDRIYDKGRTHMDALNILTNQRGTHFDAGYTIQFIECIGIFPPGCIVELSSGEVGIITEVDAKHKLRPRMMIIMDKNKTVCQERIVDLKIERLDAEGNPYRIVGVVSASKNNINIHKYYKDKAVLKAEAEA